MGGKTLATFVGSWDQPGSVEWEVGGKRGWRGYGHHWRVFQFIKLFPTHSLQETPNSPQAQDTHSPAAREARPAGTHAPKAH